MYDMGSLKTDLEEEEMSSSSDDDLMEENALSNMFVNCKFLAERKYSTNYILHLSGNQETNPHIAVGTNSNVEVLNFSDGNLVHVATLDDYSGAIIGVKFSPVNNNILYSGSTEGYIKSWDLRTPEKPAIEFKDTSIDNTDKVKPLICFDVASNDRILSAGTELHEGDAYLLFWDVRNTKLLGGYWESHTDDITTMQFHPHDVNKLVSGSTDGLINLYDLSQPCEEDALIDSLNSESSIDQLKWFRTKNSDAIACTTHTLELQLWKFDDAEPYAHFRREDIANTMKRSSASHCYLAVIQSNVPNTELLVLAGSRADGGKCARGLRVSNKSLSPAFNLPQNEQIIRSCWNNRNILVSGGECGTVNVWKLPL